LLQYLHIQFLESFETPKPPLQVCEGPKDIPHIEPLKEKNKDSRIKCSVELTLLRFKQSYFGIITSTL
jgi:hypothetical protein